MKTAIKCPECGTKIGIELGKVMPPGAATSAKKAKSSAENGKKGGRPSKKEQKA